MTYLDVLGKALSSPAIAKGANGGDGRTAGDPRPAETPARPGLLRRLFKRRARGTQRGPAAT